jgi:hypothetical protein
MAAGIAFLTAATFFHVELSRLLFLGMGGEARLTFLGFFLGGMCGGCGVLVAAAGLLQTDSPEGRVRLAPTVLFLFSLVVLFCVLAYNSFTTPHTAPQQQGESVNI